MSLEFGILAIAAFSASPIEEAVSRLGPDSDWTAVREVARYGCKAVPLLVRQLEAVETNQLNLSDSKRHPRAMRVIWSIAALRAISGRDFYTRQTSSQKSYSSRADMLRGPQGNTKLFGIWFSRGTVYFAPPMQQRQIIAKWRRYSVSRSCREGNQSQDPKFWLYGRRF